MEPGAGFVEKRWLALSAVLAIGATLIHGYHFGVDDAAIYVPAIEKAADSTLFPFGAEFFEHHSHLSLFAPLLGNTVRVLHLSVDSLLFGFHAISIFLLLLAGWQLAGSVFRTRRAQWGGVMLLAGLLTVPVAGTALVIMDPYVTARSLSTPAALFAVAGFIGERWRLGTVWLLVCAAVHPQMAFYCVVLLACLFVTGRGLPAIAAVLPGGFRFAPAHGAYRQVLFSRTYFFVYNWEWFEWVGAAAPVVLLWWFGRRAPAVTLPPFRRLCRALILFALLFTAAAIALSSWDGFQMFARLQPMRCFHLVYALFYISLGGLAGEYLLRDRAWRWCALFVPMAAGMWIMQVEAYPRSAHIELPGAAYRTGWLQAFQWVRANTPKDAIFALDPDYLAIPSVDQHGFRAVAERSMLADRRKDSGAVSLFPDLADEWKRQVDAQGGWRQFGAADYRRLHQQYGVNWVVIEKSQSDAGLTCVHENDEVRVCRVD